ncbi:Glycosyltransferase [Arcticibacter svalbardensis MN12-7]|uniref:Glycosyltransferase n=2 Tax=Arcticibacter TaxID=1288026 RepID=R9GUZ9_9SPHI|nr:Glycosyltransferase [Arcticibacter svalbardensis MN12-7]
MNNSRPQLFTWHIHGSYLYYLSQGNYDIYIPVKEEQSEGYYGRGETFPFGDNIHEVHINDIPQLDLDCIIYQTNTNYLKDQYEILSEDQRALPKVYIEHDPPRVHPTDTKHVVNDPDVLLVHVTHFNRLMWDNNGITTKVIEHGVTVPEIPYTGEIEKGIVVINNLPSRGRLLGLDIFMEVRKHIPLDLIGMNTGELGLGEVLHPQLPEFISKYRFFFNPIRYTSHGLAVCEAMMLGIPVIGMATTEMPTVITNDVNGFIHTDISVLVDKMKTLLVDKQQAIQLGIEGRKTALRRYNIQRFVQDWEETVAQVIEAQVSK